MRDLLKITLTVLYSSAPLARAQHLHHSHRKHSNLPSGYSSPFGAPSSGTGPIPSAAPSSAPYPAGNGTLSGATGTGTGTAAIISNTVYVTEHPTIYMTSSAAAAEGASPASTGGASPAGGANELLALPIVVGSSRTLAPSGTSAVDLKGSDAVGGPSATGSICAAPVTVTITSDTYITITAPGSQDQPSSPTQAPVQPQTYAPSSSPPLPQSITPSHAPIDSASGSAASLTSAPLVSSVSSAAAVVGPVSSNDGLPYSAPTSSATSAKIREDTPGFVPPTLSVTTAATPSKTLAPIVETPPSSAAASTASTSAPSSSSVSTGLTPNGKKAGVAGYRSITDKSGWSQFTSHLGWYSDYWPDTPDSGSVTGVGMLWGDGHLGGDDASRLSTFKSLTTTPKYMQGFYEPDFTPPDSSSISSASAATLWSNLLAPLKQKGTLLGSPSLATQKDESWLTPFANGPEKPTWDFTSIHTNKPSIEGVKEDVEYYLSKYKKPIWISEFACVDDKNWIPCTDAAQIKTFIQDVVTFFQGNESVVAYGYSNGNGLGDIWPMIDKSGAITASGQVYLDAISAL